jgi:hypothetical protein
VAAKDGNPLRCSYPARPHWGEARQGGKWQNLILQKLLKVDSKARPRITKRVGFKFQLHGHEREMKLQLL